MRFPIGIMLVLLIIVGWLVYINHRSNDCNGVLVVRVPFGIACVWELRELP